MENFQIEMQIEAQHMQNIFGEHDAYVKKIEDDLGVIITDRNGSVRISGEQRAVSKAAKLVNELVELSRRGNTIQEQSVSYALELSKEDEVDALLEMDSECICHTVSGKPIKPKTIGQKKYIDAIKDKMIVFGLCNRREQGKHILRWQWQLLRSRSSGGTDYTDASGNRGGREAWFSARRFAEQGRSISASLI